MQISRKILSASQDKEFHKKLANLASDDAYDVVCIQDVSALVQKVYDEMPHLVIADMHSGDAAGFDMLKRLKSDVILKHIPLIVCTDSPKVGKKIDCNANLYLHNPVMGDEIVYHSKRLMCNGVHELDVNSLTDLPGNRSCVRKIESAHREKKPFALLYLDIRNLSAYNQAYGNARGDFLIRETGNVIREIMAKHAGGVDFLGHLGGDDFIVVTDCGSASQLSEKIIEEFDRFVVKSYEREDRERGYVVVTREDGSCEHYSLARLTIAIVTNEVIEYDCISDIMKTAGEIQKYLKRFPGSAYLKDRRRHVREVYGKSSRLYVQTDDLRRSPLQDRMIPKMQELKSELDHILAGGRIDVFLQPIIHMKNKSIFGYESLSWFSKGDGTYWNSSHVFQAARESGLIREFDVLCAKKALQNAVGIPGDQKLFINLNRETLIDPGCLADILKESPVRPSQIVFELTEQSFLSEADKLLRTVESLRAQGVQIAIDDMGGGCVSLREAASLMPNYLKFDRSLIRDISRDTVKQQILLSLLVYAKGIKARTTAEGIETKDEMNYLQRSGVHFGQGYFIAKPWKMSFAPKAAA